MRSIDLDDRRDSRILHDPENTVDRRFNLIHTVGRPEFGLDGTAVSVPDILSYKDDIAFVISGSRTVLCCQEIFIVLASGWIVSGLVKVGRLHGDGRAGLCINNKCIVMQNGNIIFIIVDRMS